MFTEKLNQAGEFRRRGGFELHGGFRDRVGESDAVGVQGLLGGQWAIIAAAGQLALGDVVSAVERVADHGMTDVGHVHAELVRSPGAGKKVHEGESAEPLDDLVLGDRLLGQAVDEFGMGDWVDVLAGHDVAILERGVAAQRCIDHVAVELRLGIERGDAGPGAIDRWAYTAFKSRMWASDNMVERSAGVDNAVLVDDGIRYIRVPDVTASSQKDVWADN